WDRLEDSRLLVLDELRAVNATLRTGELAEQERARLKRRLDRTRSRLRGIEAECQQLEAEIERAFHPYWGPLLKAGGEPSSFGAQVESYACLYTGRVSNLIGYSPHHYFRGPRERLPHEL
ncbi:MAG TPA: 5'-nucleotidase domain-containing protein, partial [Polyangiales bacterium]|nr:5'-nucleotidase domain-containing protein [Polyangiales bacterium]